MAFTEAIKLKIKKRAHFRCCLCRAIGVEIHHITPQEYSGPDTEENAAPLCPSCHEIYGANPTKRKFIREARDYWYELCDAERGRGGLSLAELSEAIAPIATKRDIDDLKEQLARLLGATNDDQCEFDRDDLIPVPLERYIRSFYEEDFGDTPSGYELLFDSRMWHESSDDSYTLLDSRAFFLKAYGEETAKRLCLVCSKDVGFDPNGFTEEEFGKVLKLLHVIVILISKHRYHVATGDSLECFIRPDGEFAWRIVDPEG